MSHGVCSLILESKTLFRFFSAGLSVLISSVLSTSMQANSVPEGSPKTHLWSVSTRWIYCLCVNSWIFSRARNVSGLFK